MHLDARIAYIGETPFDAIGMGVCISQSSFAIAGICDNSDRGLAVVEDQQPDLIIIGTLEPDHQGFILCHEIKVRLPSICTILLRRDAEDHLVQADAYHSGAHGCLRNTISCEELLQAVARVLQGGVLFNHMEIDLTFTVEPLTPRQHEVLLLSAAGSTGQDIANELGIRLTTVKSHQADIRARLGVNTIAEAVTRARRRRII